MTGEEKSSINTVEPANKHLADKENSAAINEQAAMKQPDLQGGIQGHKIMNLKVD